MVLNPNRWLAKQIINTNKFWWYYILWMIQTISYLNFTFSIKSKSLPMFDLIWGNVYFCTVYVISRKKNNYIANEFEHEASTFMEMKY